MHHQENRTTKEVYDEFIASSWRSNALRQRLKGVEFVIGRRENAYLWNIEGNKRIIDCGTAGGVHSLGHRHPQVIEALRRALDDGRDTGLWALPNAEYLKLQHSLTRLAPAPELNRALATHCSTLSVDVAIMISFRMTGRQKALAYRHGYHGHSGFAAMITGSFEEGIADHFRLPDRHSAFVPKYGDLDTVSDMLDDTIAAVIIEPIEYESFAPAEHAFIHGLSELCRDRGALFILDETRTGLGRSGRLWTAEHFDLRPDILITGKGLSGGLYPVSALIMREEIYEHCINEHQFSYISSLGGNEIACIVAQTVLELSSTPAFLGHVVNAGRLLAERLDAIATRYSNIVSKGTSLGCIATLRIKDSRIGPQIYRAAFEQGVLCHSISVTEPCVLKFLPPLTIDETVIDEIYESVDRAVHQLCP